MKFLKPEFIDRSRADVVGGLIILLLFSVYLLSQCWNNWSIDLSALYFASYFYEAGEYELIYAPNGEAFWAYAHEEWRELAQQQGYYSDLLPAYVYPPIWAALLGPLAQSTDYVSFANIFLIVFVASVLGMIFLSYNIGRTIALAMGSPMPSFSLWCLISGIIVGFTSFGMLAFELGQPQIFVSFFLVLCLFATINGKDIAAGGVLAFAAAIKLMPAMMVLYFIMERRWKALAAFVVIGGVLGIISILVVGWPLHQALIDRVAIIDQQSSINRLSIGLETIAHHLELMIAGARGWQIETPHSVEQSFLIELIRRLVLLVGLALVWWSTKSQVGVVRLWIRFLLLFNLLVISSPLAWLHYLIMPALLLPGACCLPLPKWAGVFLIGCLTLMCMPVYLALADSRLAGYGEVYLHLAIIVTISGILVRVARNQRG